MAVLLLLCAFSITDCFRLKNLTDCCTKYGRVFDITYNANRSYCMVIDNKQGQEKYSPSYQ